MSGRGPGLDRASGSFRHSERYAATAARYSRALERERNVEEVARDGGGATSKGGGERESLLETPDYLERQRARNDSFKRGCGRMLVFVLVLAVFGAVAAVGFDHFGRNTLGPTPPTPAPVTTDSRQSGRVVNDRPTARAAAAKYSKYSPPPTESAETSPAEVPAPSPEEETTSSSEMTPVVEPTPAPKPKPTSEAKPTPAPKVEGTPAAKPAPKPAATASKGESTDRPAPKPAPKPAATATRDEPTLSEAARKASGTHQTHENEEPSPSKDEETSNVESDDEEEAAAAYRSLSETELADANENDDGAAEADDESARLSASEDTATSEALLLVEEAVRREKQGTGGLGSALLTGQKERLVHQFQAS